MTPAKINLCIIKDEIFTYNSQVVVSFSFRLHNSLWIMSKTGEDAGLITYSLLLPVKSMLITMNQRIESKYGNFSSIWNTMLESTAVKCKRNELSECQLLEAI